MLGRKLALACLVLVNLFLLLTLFWGEGGYFSYSEVRNRHERLAEELKDLQDQSVSLSDEITRLMENDDYQERVVRSEKNFVRENEVLYIFAPEEGTDGQGGRDEKEN